MCSSSTPAQSADAAERGRVYRREAASRALVEGLQLGRLHVAGGRARCALLGKRWSVPICGRVQQQAPGGLRVAGAGAGEGILHLHIADGGIGIDGFHFIGPHGEEAKRCCAEASDD